MSEFKALAIVPITVRWRDLDALNHVNNANYLSYLEEARLVWMTQLPEPWFGAAFMPVVASINVNYRRPIEWPADIQVELSCQRLGTSSVTIAHRIIDRKNGDCLYCDGSVTLVWIDPSTGKSITLPAVVRTACLAGL